MGKMPRSQQEYLLELVSQAGVFRPRDLDAHGLPRESLQRLYEQGLIQRTGRGLYTVTNSQPTEKQTLVEACKRIPHGIVCLLSALQFHDLTTQAPFEVWLAVGNRWRPAVDYPPVRIVYFTGKALTEGIEEHTVGGVAVKVYNPAKTVADCFKYRNKIGLDVALEALRECWRERRATMDELWRMAKICRMSNVMRPYLESLA
jgi:predicted transcriptional regulator of viral defense system